MNHLKKYAVPFINVLVLLFGFFFIFSYLYMDVCTDHDHWYPFLIVRENYYFTTPRVLSPFISSFFYVFISKITNVHINDISCTIVPFFIALGISITSFFVLKIFYLFSNNDKKILNRLSFIFYYPIIFIIIALIPVYSANMDFFFFSSINSTVRYCDHLFNFVFFAIFLYYIFKIIFKEDCKRKHIIFYLLNSVLLAMTNEYISFYSILLGFFVLVYMIFKKKNNDINNKKNLLYFLIIYGSLVLSTIIVFYISNTFTFHMTGHGEYSLFNAFIESFSSIGSFGKCFFNILIKKNSLILVPIILLNILIYVNKDEKINNIKINIMQGLCLLSLYIFSISLLFLNNVKLVYDNLNFWIEYPPFFAFYTKTLIILLMLIFGYFINVTVTKKNIKHIVNIIFIILLFAIVITNKDEIIFQYKYQREITKELREILYKSDKMSLLYSEQDGIALLPISYYEKYNQITSIYRPFCQDSHPDIRDLMKSIVEKEVNQRKSRLYTWINKGKIEAENEYLHYLFNSYGIILDGIIFVDDEKAFKEFENRGGSFSEKELKRLSFTYLKHNFVKETNLENINNKIKQYPNNSYLYASRGRYYLYKNDYSKAVNDLTRAIDIAIKQNQDIIPYYFLRSCAYIKQNELGKAINDNYKIIEFFPYSITIITDTIYFLYNENREKEAVKLYNKLINIFPYRLRGGNNANYINYNDLTKMQIQIKQYNDAIDNNIFIKRIRENTFIFNKYPASLIQ